MRRKLYGLLFLVFCTLIVQRAESQYADKSVLAEGKWMKIRVSETGIYKLTYTELQKMGFSDPSKVSVHGYGGAPLSEDFSDSSYQDDLPATAIWRGDNYLLFYAQGPIKWNYSSDGKTFLHTRNPYAVYGYYFLTDATETKEMTDISTVAASASQKIEVFDDYYLHEKELYSVSQSGRQLFGESFEANLSQRFSFNIPGITSDDAIVSFRFIGLTSTSSARVTLNVDDVDLTPVSSWQVYPYIYDDYPSYTKAKEVNGSGVWSGEKSPTPGVNISYNQLGDKNVLLDYIRLHVKRSLKSYNTPFFFFRSIRSIDNISKFVIHDATSQMLVLDVTDPQNPHKMETVLDGTELSFTIPAGSLREFALLDLSKTFTSPETVGEVVAQNLHGMGQTDMIIIAPAAFTAQAERLADEHRTRDGLSVGVITQESVFNEFSSGTPDATAIRRFMKMFYDRSTSDKDAPKYLLLFGDGAYDNRFLSSEWNRTSPDNFLLTYQSENSIDIMSYVTDDYFGMLENSAPTSGNVKLGIGRFPVRTVSEAKAAVDKVITYMDNASKGIWKNKVLFVADDGNSSDRFTNDHMSQANSLADLIESTYPEFLVNKQFFDAYTKTNEGGNTTYPAIKTNIQKLLKEGLMLINYTGHGSSEAWSDEKVLTKTDINQFTYTNLPLWITASCDFTPFDLPATSGGEDVFLRAKSGGIALFTTTRVAFSDPNFKINTVFLQNLFQKKDGRRMTLGEVVKKTKVETNNEYNHCFMLVGDPALTLAYPGYDMQVTEINGEAVTSTPVPFKALQKVTIKGNVLDANGAVATDFTGLLSITAMDSQVKITTLDNNGTGNPYSYTDYPNTIYVGNDSVRNGEFTFSFMVPKDISYSGSYGKLNLYASDEVNGNEAHGSFKNFTVGGTADVIETDTVGPEIRQLYMNDTTFVDGGKVNETPFFVARLWDQSGVNISGGSIGHDMTLMIDNSPYLTYTLNSYYQTVIGGDGEGLVRFSVPALDPGLHTAEFKVWDIQNNSSERSFTFEVAEGLKPYIMDIYASPVPARNDVTFNINHNRPESYLRVAIQVFDLSGRLQWKHEENGSSDLFKAYQVTWDLTNSAGSRLRPGIYLYRVAISTSTSQEATEAKKLIILGQ